MRTLVPIAVFALAAPLPAQEFVPPEEGVPSAGVVQLGLYGFAARLGVDFQGANEVVLSVALDAGQLFTDRVRLRPSFEVGVGDSASSYVGSLELMYRFTSDAEIAVPYVGFGVGLWSQQQCASVPDCPQAWAQFALGFELRLRNHINWLIEYHGEDALRRHRFFVGLSTRRGS